MNSFGKFVSQKKIIKKKIHFIQKSKKKKKTSASLPKKLKSAVNAQKKKLEFQSFNTLQLKMFQK